jgi:predicted nucleotidyltransferase
MNEMIDLSETKLTPEEKAGVSAFCEALRTVLDQGLQSVTLYGSATRGDYRPGESDINLLVVMEHIDVPILKTVLDPVVRARRHGLTPFFITEYNLRSSGDVFPVKFLSIKESYRVLWGRDVLRDLEISEKYLRLRCEQEIKNLLLRLRRYYIVRTGSGLADMMSQVIIGFLENLRVALALTQEGLVSREEVVEAAARTFDFEAETLRKVRSLRSSDVSITITREEAETLYDKFMAIVDKVARATDQMD